MEKIVRCDPCLIYFCIMRILYLALFTVMITFGSALAQDQKVKEEGKSEHMEQFHKNHKPTSNSLIHTFVCRRCGSENKLEWGFPATDKNLQLIPHCGFCGKKYWPKFKPTGMLERTYCRTESISERKHLSFEN